MFLFNNNYEQFVERSKINKRIYFVYLFCFNVLFKYIYSFMLKEKLLYINVLPNDLIKIVTFFKYNSIVKLHSLLDIAVTDNISLTKDSGRFVLNYVFWNYTYEYRIILRITCNVLQPLFSISYLYSSSDWLEREAWDMFGIKFLFHSNLRRILTDYGFNGHPFRKDFPLIGYFEVFYDDSKQVIAIHPVEVAQTLRFYQLENPWNKWYY